MKMSNTIWKVHGINVILYLKTSQRPCFKPMFIIGQNKSFWLPSHGFSSKWVSYRFHPNGHLRNWTRFLSKCKSFRSHEKPKVSWRQLCLKISVTYSFKANKKVTDKKKNIYIYLSIVGDLTTLNLLMIACI